MNIRTKKGKMCYAPIGNIWLAFGMIHCKQCRRPLIDPEIEDCLFGSEETPLALGYVKLNTIPQSFGDREKDGYICSACSRNELTTPF